jgi:hypothetical protein
MPNLNVSNHQGILPGIWPGIWIIPRIIATCALVAALSLMTTGCSSQQGNLFGAGPHMGSFLGVSFGDLRSDVMMKFPTARPETSPYGAETIRLTNVRTSSVMYRYVLFEFLWRGGGMQLVIAGFEPIYANALLGDLQAQLGGPNQVAAAASDRRAELRWLLDNGTQVTFDRAEGVLVIVGPRGKVLEDDVAARRARRASDLPS